MNPHETKDSKGRQQTRGQKILVYTLLAIFICILAFSLLVPHRHDKPWAWVIKQKAQLNHLNTALELWESEFDAYPPSDALDGTGAQYCAAMKICEAVMGQDLRGYHPDSDFRSDGTDDEGNALYPDSRTLSVEDYRANLASRKGPYLPLDNANAYSLLDLYGEGNTGPFEPNHFIICDVFKHVKHRSIRKKVGMPVLYYKADTSKTAHDVTDPNNPQNIYDYRDNHALLALGVPGKPGVKHPMYEDPNIFYEITWNAKDMTKLMPHRADTYILLSAGPDGLYGTKDDIANFDFEWKRK